MKRKRRIGILGGTFNPIHLGHLMIAEMAMDNFALDFVIFVPSYHPPHKTDDVIAARHRYEMTAAAVLDNPKFTVSDVEIKRGGFSYSIDTVAYFRELYGEDNDFYFIAGTDTIHELPNWKHIHQLLEWCSFIGAVRPDGTAQIDRVIEYFGSLGQKKIQRMAVPEMKLSATDLRHRLRIGKSVRYMIPNAVIKYIDEHDIYSK